jgi:beta-carotene hydroxylase
MFSGAERPRLPEHLRAPADSFGLVFCAYALLLFLIPAALSIFLLEGLSSPWLMVILLLPLWLVAQQGIHLLGMVGHEGLHGNLHRNRLLSVHLGLFFSSMAISYLVTGYFVTHWHHHLYTNTEDDPDVEACSKFNTFWSRCFLSRMHLTKIYRKSTYQLAFGREFTTDHLPFGLRQLRTFARLNLLYQLFWIAAYALVGIVDVMWLFVAIIVPHLGAVVASGLRVYVEHAGTDAEPGREARSFSSRLWTILFFGNNLHLEHHLYPNVPCHRLPALHEWLKKQGFFESHGSYIEPRSSAVFKYAGAGYPYSHADGRLEAKPAILLGSLRLTQPTSTRD